MREGNRIQELVIIFKITIKSKNKKFIYFY